MARHNLRRVVGLVEMGLEDLAADVFGVATDGDDECAVGSVVDCTHHGMSDGFCEIAVLVCAHGVVLVDRRVECPHAALQLDLEGLCGVDVFVDSFDIGLDHGAVGERRKQQHCAVAKALAGVALRAPADVVHGGIQVAEGDRGVRVLDIDKEDRAVERGSGEGVAVWRVRGTCDCRSVGLVCVFNHKLAVGGDLEDAHDTGVESDNHAQAKLVDVLWQESKRCCAAIGGPGAVADVGFARVVVDTHGAVAARGGHEMLLGGAVHCVDCARVERADFSALECWQLDFPNCAAFVLDEPSLAVARDGADMHIVADLDLLRRGEPDERLVAK
eukprot:comp22382_c0_seq1/m.54275 comp22382_c0_seq1/g.54275  ORF comp22382_c0_seq1/g.54275 comp22382_c0_seq1/m.54275 type:complete len:330 (-) comp22382_c0_seq1:1098-2087(-)